jgi:tRNA A-37 threonylcarbamoyl transferase component Bud32
MMPPGPLLGSGRDADVYALDEHRVLRRYRAGGDVTEEAAVMAYAGRRGFAVPAVYEADGPDLVMERLTGPTLLRSLLDGATSATVAAGLLADLHTRLHALPARRSNDPAVRIIHLDLHPDNVILSGRGPMLIDWRNADEGPPDLDVALTALILAEVAAGSHHPAFAPTARRLLDAFLAAAGSDPLSQLDQALAFRSADSNLRVEEKARLARAAALVREAMP